MSLVRLAQWTGARMGRVCAGLVAAGVFVVGSASGAVVPGSIPGAFQVGDQGQGRYSIPIVVPEGVGGLRPSLALTYNHMSGSGLAGMRWSLAGISAITRCSQSYAQDGQVVGISYAMATARFCLDGQRLVNKSGTYGASGTEYRTEFETFQRIVQQGTLNGGPQSFYVDHGNGLRSWFGATNDSRVASGPGNGVRTWYISSTEDQYGNKIEYSYDLNSTTGEAVPTEITWSRNSALSPRYRIAITYQNRPADDQRSGHDAGGGKWAQTKRISRIEAYYDGTTLISRYDLTYTTPPTTGTGRSQLQKVTLCRDTECLPETLFTLQNGTRSWNSMVNTNRSTGTAPLTGDWNGDGRQDVFVCLSGTWRVYPGTASGSLDSAQNSSISCATNPDRAQVLDFNGNGYADLLIQHGTTWQVLHANGAGLTNTGIATSAAPYIDARDIDGDGLVDIAYRTWDNVTRWRRNTGGAFGAEQVLISTPTDAPMWIPHERWPDVNGNGRADFIGGRTLSCQYMSPYGNVCTFRWSVYRNEVGGVTEMPIVEFTNISWYADAVRTIDVNGDGLSDILYRRSDTNTWWLRISTGTGLANPINTGIPATNPAAAIIVDYDGDGRQDLVRPDGNFLRIHRSNGTTLPSSPTESLSSSGAGSATAFAADITGNGYADIVRSSGSNWHIHKHKSDLADVVTTFTNGLSYSVDVFHEPLSSSSHYSVNAGHSPPAPYVRRYNGSRHVVVTELHDTGVGSAVREYNHHYDTAYVDHSGRGWLSFHSHQVRDEEAGTYTRRTFSRTYPFAGMAELDELRVITGNALVRDVARNLDKETWTSTTPNLQFPFVATTTTREYEHGGLMHGQHLRTAVNQSTYNTQYGTITQMVETVTQPSTSEQWTSTTVFNPVHYATPWCLGLPGLVETTTTAPGVGSALRRLNHVYNSTTCRLTQLTDQSETDATKQHRTTYAYHATHGHVTSTTERNAAGTGQARTTTFQYGADQHYPTKATIGTVNLETSFTWDHRLGMKLSETGWDGLTTSWQYDAFGRTTRETRPGGGYTQFTYADCGSCFALNSRFFVRALDTDGSDSTTYFDRLGRVVGTAAKLPLGTEGREEIRYSVRGEVAQRSRPYVQFQPVYWVTYQYDVLGRVTEEDAPISESLGSGAFTYYDYRGHELWVTNPESQTTKRVHDARGQIRQVIDALSGTLNYTYRPFGELHTVTDAESRVTTLGYDARGNKTSMTDPNMGTWSYGYTVFGELSSQTNALSQTVTLAYDQAGRMTQRVEPEGTTTFSYWTTGTGRKGRAHTIAGPGHSEYYEYHGTYGAPTLVRRTFDGTQYNFNYEYDGQGRLTRTVYPVTTSSYRFRADNEYDSWGHLYRVRDGNTSAVLYTLEEADALGREVHVLLGNGLREYRTFDRAVGHLRQIETGPTLSVPTVQDLEFEWDMVGNLTSRHNALINRTEVMDYDALNRLTYTQVLGQSGVNLVYSAGGRITSKTGLGTYSYASGSHPYAVTSAGGVSYSYDANGRMTSRGGQTLEWYSYDLPKKLAAGTRTSEFSYGVHRDRYKQVQKTGGTTNATIRYVGGLYEVETAGSTTTYRHFIQGRERVIAMVTRVGSTNTVRYLHRDHQGSVVEVTNAGGSVVESLAFDAWGLRRNASTWAPLANPFSGTHLLKRGYTGHEHLDTVELIHMNGRVQDPRIGRFVSPDPIVQAPHHTQSYNRYSYVWNNPASLVDPSGFCAKVDGSWQGCPETFADTSQIEEMLRQYRWWLESKDAEYQIWMAQTMEESIGSSYAEMGLRRRGASDTPQGGQSASPPPSWLQTSGVCLGGCHGTTPAGEIRQMTPTEELILHAGAAIVTIPVGGEFVILVRAGLAARGGLLFGQASVKSTFAHGPHAGRTIGEVAQGLRAGRISPDTLPIDFVVRNGQAIALNNRSLLALQRAGMQPTVTRNLTGNQAAEALLNSHLRGGVPSNVIRVRGGPPGTSLIE